MFKKSFTLIELLVVISIISILTSLLLPSLASAKGKAQQAACSSNLKQVGMGFLLYTDDYDGCLAPYSSVPPATIPHWYWADMFVEYFDTSAKRSQIPGTDSVGDIGLEQNWMTYSRLMDCPTADRPGEYEYTYNTRHGWWTGNTSNASKKIDKYPDPSRFIRVIENGLPTGGGNPEKGMNPVQASQTLRLSQSPVHIQQNNSLFMDLHVEPYSAQKLIYYSTTGISTDKYPFQVPGW